MRAKSANFCRPMAVKSGSSRRKMERVHRGAEQAVMDLEPSGRSVCDIVAAAVAAL